jgi:DNA sulfur modification protein DndE
MKAPVEHVKVSARGKDILIKVKRYTGLEHWNVICRIALCRSLAEPTPPPKLDKSTDSTIEMDWKTFAGQHKEVLAAVTLVKAQKDGIDVSDEEALSWYFKAHIERGIETIQKLDCLSAFLNL